MNKPQVPFHEMLTTIKIHYKVEGNDIELSKLLVTDKYNSITENSKRASNYHEHKRHQRPLDMGNLQDFATALRRVVALARTDYQDKHYLGEIKIATPLRKSDRNNSSINRLVFAENTTVSQGSLFGLIYDNVFAIQYSSEVSGE